MHFQSPLAALEPEIYVVVEQFGTENISLVSGHLVTEALTVNTEINSRKSFECSLENPANRKTPDRIKTSK